MTLRRTLQTCAAALALTLPALAATMTAAMAEVRVAVSIKPLHSLVAAVMAGAGEPELIIEGGSSPHTYALKPSDAKALQEAGLVFFMDENLERFLVKPMAALAGAARIVTLSQAPGLTYYPLRSGGAWEADDDDAEEAGGTDPHMWLDPANAAAMTDAIAAALTEADPASASAYAANATALKAKLHSLDDEMRQALAPVKDKPFIVFHDGFQYLEKRFGLKGVGAITISAEVEPGAKRVAEIHERIKTLDVACIFSEPQFPPAIVEVVREGTDARAGVLDPVGADLAAGPDLYFELMRRDTAAIVQCLGG